MRNSRKLQHGLTEDALVLADRHGFEPSSDMVGRFFDLEGEEFFVRISRDDEREWDLFPATEGTVLVGLYAVDQLGESLASGPMVLPAGNLEMAMMYGVELLKRYEVAAGLVKAGLPVSFTKTGEVVVTGTQGGL